MWVKILGILSKYLGGPLAKLGSAVLSIFINLIFDRIVGYFKEKQEQKKRADEIKEKVEDYKNSQTPEEQEDAFDKLVENTHRK